MNVTVEDIFESQTYRDDKEKNWNTDPLVLSCSAKELLQDGKGYLNLEDLAVLENVKSHHYDLAENIRKYYTKKFFWKSLSDGRSLSPFRQRLCYLLENRSLTTVDRDAGIYYKIPWFYDEDMNYDDFKKKYNTTDLPRYRPPGHIYPQKQIISLTYLTTTVSRQQKRNLNRFWFTDETYLYTVEVTNDNLLLNLFKQLVVDQLTVTLETHYTIDRIDQMYFYKLHNFSLAKETHA
jgi:hypothetical protein